MTDRGVAALASPAVMGAAVTGLGAVMVTSPRLIGRVWIGDDAARPRVRMLLRVLGARDLALGLGLLLAARRDAPVRGWLEATALAAASDAAATLLAWPHLSWTGRVAGTVPSVGAASVATGLARRT